MRSRPESALPLLATLALLCAAPVWSADDSVPTQTEVDRAVETVKKDPNLAAEKSIRTLRWEGSDDEEEKPKERSTHWPSWLGWLGDLFGWIGQASQMLVWLLLAALVGLLALLVARMVRGSHFEKRGVRFVAPTHVQDMDIRPESLPPDIGAAARELWDRGDHRAALALLYRGLLSRLAHVHEIAIRDSSTEGDCLALAAHKLDPVRVAYVTQLIRTWQRFTYGGVAVETAVVHELCAAFAMNLDAPDGASTGDGAARFAGAGA